MIRSGTLVFVLVMVMVPTGLRPCEGLACPPIAATGAPGVLIPKLSRSGQQCAANSYVQTLQSYPVDAYSEGWGSCDVYVLDGATGNCIFDRTEQRGVVGVNVQEVGVAGQAVFVNNPSNAPPPHIFDTPSPVPRLPRTSRGHSRRSETAFSITARPIR
jgi:hypothetical protein